MNPKLEPHPKIILIFWCVCVIISTSDFNSSRLNAAASRGVIVQLGFSSNFAHGILFTITHIIFDLSCLLYSNRWTALIGKTLYALHII